MFAKPQITRKSLVEAVYEVSVSQDFLGAVFIDLWSNQYRYKDIFFYNPKEKYCFDNNNQCQMTGKKKGYIGDEKVWIDYVNNLWYITTLLKKHDIFFITNKELPVWINTSYLPTLGNPPFNKHFVNYYLTTENKYLIHFHTKEKPSKNKIIISKDRLFNFINKSSIVINPTKKVLSLAILNAVPKIYICNEQIKEKI